MDFLINQMDKEHLQEAMDLVKRVFMEFEAQEYQAFGVKHFLDYISLEQMEKKISKDELQL